MNFDVQAILAAFPSKGPLVVAIDGGSGSGKTTLGQALASALSAPLVSLDDFLFNVSDEVLDRRSPEQNFLHAFDRPAIAAALRDHRQAKAIVVVEGVYSLRPEWSDLIDLRIWIEMSPALRLERMIVRQANTDSQMRLWQATENWYVESFDPKRTAHLIVDGASGKLTRNL